MIAQQIVFGYREGHRRLAGSAELDRLSDAALLGATDAAISSRSERLISALPLPSVGHYAVCGTWSDPEADRPGAVWAHALLIPLSQLGDLSDLYGVVSALRRPSRETLAGFSDPIRLEERSTPDTADPRILTEILTASIDPARASVVATTDLIAGETTLIALWNAAWAELRAVLSFRTRERVKASPKLSYICVARRVTGMGRPGQAMSDLQAAGLAAQGWVEEITHRPPRRGRRGVREFLQTFGSEAPTTLAQFVALGELHELVDHNDVRGTAQRLAEDYPTAQAMVSLKTELFGSGPDDWWDVSELDLILAVFDVGGRGFDLRKLAFPRRLRQLIADGHALTLIEADHRARSKRLANLLLNALIDEATPSLLAATMNADPSLAQQVLAERPELLESGQTWRELESDQALTLAKNVRLSDRAIAAAVMSDSLSALAKVVSLPTAAVRLFRSRQLDAFARLFDPRHSGKPAVAGDVADDLRIEAAASGIDVGTDSDLLNALDARRTDVHEEWLRAAVRVLTQQRSSQRGDALEVVFGPLHHAVTDDRLPHELWNALGKITPDAADPAQRLRRLLLQRARKEHWSRETLERALRGSGPHVKEFRSELEDDEDDLFAEMATPVLRKWKRFV